MDTPTVSMCAHTQTYTDTLGHVCSVSSASQPHGTWPYFGHGGIKAMRFFMAIQNLEALNGFGQGPGFYMKVPRVLQGRARLTQIPLRVIIDAL